MFSVYGDTVLDPFLGTGTTTVAAAAAGRNSVGYEIDTDLRAAFDDRRDDVPARFRRHARDRLDAHREWVADRRDAGTEPNYEADNYDVGMTTKQERRVRFYVAEEVRETAEGYAVGHRPLVTDSTREGIPATEE